MQLKVADVSITSLLNTNLTLSKFQDDDDTEGNSTNPLYIKKENKLELQSRVLRQMFQKSPEINSSSVSQQKKIILSADLRTLIESLPNLIHDIFHPLWERRHGSLLALKAVVKSGFTNEIFLEAISVRALVVLSGDQFVDQAGDELVAPVRESAAQLLSLSSLGLSSEVITSIFNVLKSLAKFSSSTVDDWHARYGGWLGLKYMLAVHPQTTLLPELTKMCGNSLEHVIEAVGCIAADALTPCAPEIVSMRLHTPLLVKLWTTLGKLSPECSEAGGWMKMIVAIFREALKRGSRTEVPAKYLRRIYPFMRHPISYVRKASIQTLSDLTGNDPDPVTLGILYENLVLEHDEGTRRATNVVFQSILRKNKKINFSRANGTRWLEIPGVSDENVLPSSLVSHLSVNDIRTKLPLKPRQIGEQTSMLNLESRLQGTYWASRLIINSNPQWLQETLRTFLCGSTEQIIVASECVRVAGRHRVLSWNDDIWNHLHNISKSEEKNEAHVILALCAIAISGKSSDSQIGDLQKILEMESREILRDRVAEALVVACRIKEEECENPSTILRCVTDLLNFSPDIHHTSDEYVPPPPPPPSDTQETSTKLGEEEDIEDDSEESEVEERELIESKLTAKEGAISVIKAAAKELGKDIFKINGLKTLIRSLKDEDEDNDRASALMWIYVLAEHGEEKFSQEQIVPLTKDVIECATKAETEIERDLAIRTFAQIVKINQTFPLSELAEWLQKETSDLVSPQRKAITLRLVTHAVNSSRSSVIPYSGILTLPALTAMAHQDKSIRDEASKAFNALVHILPLEPEAGDPPGFSKSLRNLRENSRTFVRQLLEGASIEDHPLHFPPENVVLRPYQAEGVAWLIFLKKFGMHGALCDDMGLGKTLQASCAIAEYIGESSDRIPSLVVAPPTLVENWVMEINRFYPNMSIYGISGTPSRRREIISKIEEKQDVDVVIMSYPSVLSHSDWIQTKRWGYCILDEGHIIRSSTTRLAQAVRRISCKHRLLLSGTPIQNSALDLYNIFEFLMPGYLGTDKEFRKRYENPIKRSAGKSPTNAAKEAGALAMENLHKAVLLFILRRTKTQVLKDLPPKIIQDVSCEMSRIQKKLYTAAAAAVDINELSRGANKTSKDGARTLQSLSILRKVCVHPSLVISNSEQLPSVLDEADKSSINVMRESGKLLALEQILTEGRVTKDSRGLSGERSRFLIYTQYQSSLDLVKKFVESLGVSTRRLDGTVPENLRAKIANDFNQDASIDALLLTTKVGGLGLTLTGADKVIFIEHDWNPQNDIQAMDRAHRIGQKKTVFVYRLIMKESIEEDIMSKQHFKLHMANTIVNTENVSMKSMDTKRLMDAFHTRDTKRKKLNIGGEGLDAVGELTIGSGKKNKNSIQSYLKELGDLSDEEQYQEFNFTKFISNVRKNETVDALIKE